MPAKNPVIRPILAPIHPPNDPKSVAPSIERILLFKMHTSYVPNLAGGMGGAVLNRTKWPTLRVHQSPRRPRDTPVTGDDPLETGLRIVPFQRAE